LIQNLQCLSLSFLVACEIYQLNNHKENTCSYQYKNYLTLFFILLSHFNKFVSLLFVWLIGFYVTSTQ
jgi:hypothetical protein